MISKMLEYFTSEIIECGVNLCRKILWGSKIDYEYVAFASRNGYSPIKNVLITII